LKRENQYGSFSSHGSKVELLRFVLTCQALRSSSHLLYLCSPCKCWSVFTCE